VSSIVQSVRAEYSRYKALGEGAFAQLRDDQLAWTPAANANSIATIVWHVSGNLVSRFTDFLTTDGEKPDRNRDEEFAQRSVTRAELLEKWERGWRVLFASLDALTDADLERTVTIRSQAMLVHEALHRSLAHTSYHVGQILFIAKAVSGPAWRYLSIPPGQSAAYNAATEKS
jgi:uncharacterized damage-inducible protein DinB